ncbi:hypothetical protein K227x_33060 [Rubripirellula lacrimiformis]|uniref:Uncharacterized protein n=1 Tax=Rubripirellula lacrimiformis TaxID=1930273 RepID=A0A517NCP8_9BACT|nr:hypothetical protein [Rubripirellula lacrimiformis]QDT04909.1 hypothetical protein K227x_33060 [Rubripirellula lacrimiformis]
MVDGFAKAPRYVLKDGSRPTCPSVLQASSDSVATVVFGFSDKPEYDAFQAASSIALTPYPLVKGYLQNQIELDTAALNLVVVDATAAGQPILNAATFESVLESFQLNSDTVAISHRLVFDESASGYRIEESSLVPGTGPVA